jgi:hypothetical protein
MSRRNFKKRLQCTTAIATGFLCNLASGPAALADSDVWQPGNLLVSRVIYDNNPNNVTVGMTLPSNWTPRASL